MYHLKLECPISNRIASCGPPQYLLSTIGASLDQHRSIPLEEALRETIFAPQQIPGFDCRLCSQPHIIHLSVAQIYAALPQHIVVHAPRKAVSDVDFILLSDEELHHSRPYRPWNMIAPLILDLKKLSPHCSAAPFLHYRLVGELMMSQQEDFVALMRLRASPLKTSLSNSDRYPWITLHGRGLEIANLETDEAVEHSLQSRVHTQLLFYELIPGIRPLIELCLAVIQAHNI